MKMEKIFLMFVFAILLGMPGVFALTQVNIYVDGAGDALFLGFTDDGTNLPDGIKVEDGKVSGFTSALTTKSGELWTFETFLKNTEMNVILPEGAKIINVTNGEIFLEGGQIAVYVWEGTQIKYRIEKKDNSGVGRAAAWIIFIILLVFMVYVINYVLKERKSAKKKTDEKLKKTEGKSKVGKKFDKAKAIEGILNEREKLIVAALRKVGKTKGSFLRREVDIPKASFSRHIQELEKKGLIKRSGEGRNKFVELVD